MQTSCYHCGLPNDPHQVFSTLVLKQPQVFCCPGCLAVAEAIVKNGLEDYYHYRDEFAEKANSDDSDILQTLSVFDDDSILDEFVETTDKKSEIQLSVSGINCAACAWLIEKQLAKVDGVLQIGVNVSSRRAVLSWDTNKLKLSQILAQLEKIGYHAKPFQPEQHEASYRRENKRFLMQLGLAGLMTMQVMMLNIGVFFDLFGHLEAETKVYFNWVSLLLTTPVVLYSSAGFYASASKALSAKTVNMDVPISVALTIIFASSLFATIQQVGQTYFESLCMFVFLLLISRYLEHGARYKASQISSNMLEYIPTSAMVLDGQQTKAVLAKSLVAGQEVIVKAGELVPIDGTVMSGQGQLDEALLTGEFSLVDKQPGDKVYAGTQNQLGTLTIRVDNNLKHSVVNQIANMQTQAMANKPRIANIADQFSQYFVGAVLVLSVIAYVVWLNIDPSQALWITISVLIATCPCALGLATPSALSCAIANLNSKGILLKRSDALEQLTKVDWIGLDKTGTLTEGRFSIQQTVNLGHLPDQDLLSIAASLEQYSSHPIAKAFADLPHLLKVEDFSADIGLGISGTIQGVNYKFGSASYIQQPLPAELAQCNIVLLGDNQLLGGFVLNDQIRQESQDLLSRWKNKSISLISGDCDSAVAKVANTLHISNWYAKQSPEDKLKLVTQAQQQGYTVLMVGDGINDGPVLAQADVSVTLGAGSDLAKSSADVILLDDSLDKLDVLLTLSKRCKQKIKQNIGWAIGYNITVLPLAFIGYLSPWMAVIGMSLSSLIVVVNSIRLLK